MVYTRTPLSIAVAAISVASTMAMPMPSAGEFSAALTARSAALDLRSAKPLPPSARAVETPLNARSFDEEDLEARSILSTLGKLGKKVFKGKHSAPTVNISPPSTPSQEQTQQRELITRALMEDELETRSLFDALETREMDEELEARFFGILAKIGTTIAKTVGKGVIKHKAHQHNNNQRSFEEEIVSRALWEDELETRSLFDALETRSMDAELEARFFGILAKIGTTIAKTVGKGVIKHKAHQHNNQRSFDDELETRSFEDGIEARSSEGELEERFFGIFAKIGTTIAKAVGKGVVKHKAHEHKNQRSFDDELETRSFDEELEIRSSDGELEERFFGIFAKIGTTIAKAVGKGVIKHKAHEHKDKNKRSFDDELETRSMYDDDFETRSFEEDLEPLSARYILEDME